jgi:glycosyltransferase involved in cell wall biosynthesis
MRDYLAGENIDPNKVAIVDFEGHALHESSPTSGLGRGDRGGRESCQLLFVGRVAYSKGLQYLLEAVGQLDSSYCLDVVGDGWFLPKAIRLAQDLGVEERTVFWGRLAGMDLEQAYQRADIVVVPSILPEPLGLVVGEARHRGILVTVSNAGGLPEWAEGDPGVAVAPRADAAGLASTIARVRRWSPIDRPRTARHSQSLSDAIIKTMSSTNAIRDDRASQ